MAGEKLSTDSSSEVVDVVVVGAGIGGICALHRFREAGLSVAGFEAAPDVGGVWYHNRYPGARVDLESQDYCYFFSEPLYREWKWSERYAAQPEILDYLNHVVDRFDIRPLISFETRVEAAHWRSGFWHVRPDRGREVRCRYLVMATGNLSAARQPDFAGLDGFEGEWIETSNWPRKPVDFAGRRVGVVGTGSSGVQCIPVIAEQARRLHVFQRTPNYSIPAQNTPSDHSARDRIGSDMAASWASLLTTVIGKNASAGQRGLVPQTAAEMPREAQLQQLERAWIDGGHAVATVFSDQGTNRDANDIVARFTHDKIRQIVDDPAVAEALIPSYPIGTRRLCVDTNYYETYNRPNVSLVDLRAEPFECFYRRGVRTAARDYELDLVVFALGFDAFSGQLDRIDIRNEKGAHLTQDWARGPKAYLGLMVPEFPNLFLLTGPGSPSVLSNLFALNEYHVGWLAGLIARMKLEGHATVTATAEAQEAWTLRVQNAARHLLRFSVPNYMVHVNEHDQTRLFIPYAGGLNRYVEHCDRLAGEGYPGLIFGDGDQAVPAGAVQDRVMSHSLWSSG